MTQPITSQLKISIANKLSKSVYVKVTASRLQSASTEDSSEINYSRSEHSNYSNQQRQNRNYEEHKQHNQDSLYNETHVDNEYNRGSMAHSTSVNTSVDNTFHQQSDHRRHNINETEEKKMDESAISGLDENYTHSAHHAEYELKSANPGYATIQSGASLPFPVETSSGIAFIYAYLRNDDQEVKIADGQPIDGESYEIKTNDHNSIGAMVSPVQEQSRWRDTLNNYGFNQVIQDKMQQEGWNDMDNWKQIDDTIMTAELGFKSGHVVKFKKMMQELYPPEPEPEPEPEPVDPFVGVWMFENVISKRFIHQCGGTNKLMQWDKEGGDNQRFEVNKSVNNDGIQWYTIEVKPTGRYWSIEYKSQDHGAKLVERTFDNKNEFHTHDQQYTFVEKGDNIYGIQVRHSEKWLYVENMGKHNKGKINQGDWGETDNYRWKMVKA